MLGRCPLDPAHRQVAEHRDQFLAAHSDKFLCVLDVPLLFETKGERDCDVVVVVSTKSEAIQRERVLARPRMTQDKLSMILGKQMPDAEKRARADFVIDTSSPCLTAMRCQVAELVESLADAFPGPFRDKVLERGDQNSSELVAVRAWPMILRNIRICATATSGSSIDSAVL